MADQPLGLQLDHCKEDSHSVMQDKPSSAIVPLMTMRALAMLDSDDVMLQVLESGYGHPTRSHSLGQCQHETRAGCHVHTANGT